MALLVFCDCFFLCYYSESRLVSSLERLSVSLPRIEVRGSRCPKLLKLFVVCNVVHCPFQLRLRVGQMKRAEKEDTSNIESE